MKHPTAAPVPCQHDHAPTTLPQLRLLLAVAGWKLGLPDGLDRSRAEVDSEACWVGECNHCGACALTFVPFRRGDEYKPVAACRACGAAEVF